MNPTPLVEAVGIDKRFGGVRALSSVSLRIEAGEVLAVVGENGAGKSTLMKVVAGVHRPDAGSLYVRGKPASFAGVADALREGIALIHQELNLAENLGVSANLFLGREETAFGFLRNGEMNRRARELMGRVGLAVSPDRVVGELPPGQRQLVEIARALSLDARLIIMDEPTSSLTQRETDRLYEVIDDLRRGGVAVLYISHRLAEVKRVADRVTVLRDGANAGELARDEVSHDSLVRLMVGRDLKQIYPPRPGTDSSAKARLSVRGLTYRDGPTTPVSFDLRAGEIVGMAGLVGAGRTELAEALYGLRPVASGEVLLDGRPVRFGHPREAIAAGLLLVPEDRRRHGLILPEHVRGNLSLPNLGPLSVLGWVLPGRERELARRQMARLRVKASGQTQAVGTLSGGNQQKVVVGKWLAMRPAVLIFDEPTRGVDVGARSEIYALMAELAAEGVAVLMISSDLEEVLGMSDRVLVLYEGRLAGELGRGERGEEAVMRLATGGGR